ncbi:LysR family transcriptional regulator [Pseudomonas aeruginosa]|uniref:LysR family transcriptional regulator n=1 Tax=Pseudomonas aeruginosa TaxID=287 RepID=UPI000E32065E|nr:LysR family transcriptional regulator [Pseudomonas aeruginosa]RFJ37262.1 LysR family transcriptional regulator [Pseudomonas aeruginosa]HBP1402574.1 LysR family transcriptional regulator [Pseudomonas aeruginosa]
MFDWNDLRFFLELQRSGRLLTAAKRLGTTHATVARHIENIERDLGTQLFAQHTGGYQLTPAGQALLKHAEAMENTALLAQEEMSQSISPLGQIRIGVTEGLGSVFLAPRLAQLMHHYPGLEVELVSVPRFVSITNREADIAISLDRPSADLVITRLLTRYRLALFASPAYLEQAPPLRDRDDLGRHQWIGYVDDLLFSQELMFHHSFCRHPQVVFRSTSVVAQQQAAQAGIGLAILPHFMGSRDPLLVPVLPEESIQREYWMSTRRELHRSVRLRVVWDFLLELCQREREVLLGPSATPPP